jgi:MSHA pilin protein MshD
MCTARAPRRSRGFTLAELLLLIVVLAIGLGGIISVYVTTVAGSADPLVRKQAMAVAEAMMDEIMLQAYADPGTAAPPTGPRQLFDSVDDYATYTSTGVKDLAGGAVTGLGNFNVDVAVAGPATVNGAADAKLITVTVTGPGLTFKLQGYKVN